MVAMMPLRRRVHVAVLAVVALLFAASVPRAQAQLTGTQLNSTLGFLQNFATGFSVLSNNWTGTDYCSWAGVSCDNVGNAIINLNGFGLVGTMPEVPSYADGASVMISSMDLSNNPDWNSRFSSSWGSLVNLRYLDLSNTSLYERIPDAWNGMTALEVLYIAKTYACQDFPNLNIATLTMLDLSDNAFTGSLPDSWSLMTALQSVLLNNTYPCGCVPDSWTESAVLTAAAASAGSGVTNTATCDNANSCADVTSHCLSYSSDVAGLTLSQRHTLTFLSDFPFDLEGVSDTWTGKDYCTWDGVSCDADGNVTVSLSGKGLSGFMPSVDPSLNGWYVQVVSIDLSNNPAIDDNFKEEWGDLKRLKFLNLSYTGLYGALPSYWGGMVALEEAYISNTSACTSLPDWTLSNLRIIDLSNNNMRGSLLTEWAAMTTLTSATLTGNSFCGCVPDSWASSAVLTAAANAVGGSLVASDCATSNVCTADGLNCVELPPYVTDTSATLAFLRNFPGALRGISGWTGTAYCSWNGVSCDNSSGIAAVSVSLSGRGLSGYMPSLGDDVDGSAVQVVSIDLSNNPDIAGNFKDEWAGLTQLQKLDLSNTDLRGNIPDAWNGMKSLRTVKITNTYACRNLPNWNMNSLVTADLSSNQMGGTLASSWSGMTTLTSATLTGNSFCGCVPQSWASSTVLTTAANAVGGNLVSSNCTTTNTCGSASYMCNAATGPVQLSLAVVAALLALAAVLGL